MTNQQSPTVSLSYLIEGERVEERIDIWARCGSESVDKKNSSPAVNWWACLGIKRLNYKHSSWADWLAGQHWYCELQPNVTGLDKVEISEEKANRWRSSCYRCFSDQQDISRESPADKTDRVKLEDFRRIPVLLDKSPIISFHSRVSLIKNVNCWLKNSSNSSIYVDICGRV